MKVDGNNLSMIRGDSESITITFTNENDEQIPLVSGDKIYFTVKTSTTVKEKLIQKLITAFQDGDAIIEIDPDDTKDLAYRAYVYDVQWVDRNDKKTTVIEPAVFKIDPEVTFE